MAKETEANGAVAATQKKLALKKNNIGTYALQLLIHPFMIPPGKTCLQADSWSGGLPGSRLVGARSYLLGS